MSDPALNPAPGAVPVNGSVPSVAPPLDWRPETPATTPVTPPSVAVPVSPVPPPSAGLLDQARRVGVELGTDFESEEAALRGLLGAYQQTLALEQDPYFRAYREHAPQFHGWLRQQQAAKASPEPAQPESWWNPPLSAEEALRIASTYYETDPTTGRPRPTAQAPAEAIAQLEQYRAYVDRFRSNFFSNPAGTLKPLLAEVTKQAKEEALRELQGLTTQQREVSQAQQIINSNADWIYVLDQRTKQPIVDASGNPVFSQAGVLYQRYVGEADRMGIRGTQQQHKYAQDMVYANLLMQRHQGSEGGNGAPPPAPAAAGRMPSSIPPPPSAGTPATGHNRLSLKEQLRAAFRENGLTDADFVGNMVGR